MLPRIPCDKAAWETYVCQFERFAERDLANSGRLVVRRAGDGVRTHGVASIKQGDLYQYQVEVEMLIKNDRVSDVVRLRYN